jgi:SAM-dependent methyltransferase
MGQSVDWHEDDDFWSTTESILFGEKRLAAADGEIDQILELTEVSSPAAVLDLCCGIGRHSLALARKGLAVTGVDRTPRYLDRARTAAQQEGLEIDWVHEDMRRFRRPEGFALAINLFTSFGYFADPRENQLVLENTYASLCPGGSLVIQLMGKEVIARTFRPMDWLELEDGALFLEKRTLEPDWSRIHTRWILVRDGTRKDLDLSLHLYSAVELSAMLRECGFAKIAIHADFEGSPYDHQAKRLVAVAHKPD